MNELMRNARPPAAGYPMVEESSGAMLLAKYLMPWGLALLAWPLGWIGHKVWADGPALPWITAALAVGTCGLSWLGWTVGRARQLGPAGRGQVAGTIAVTGLWFLFAVVAGPGTRGVLDAWGLLLFAIPISWNLRTALHRPARGGEEDGMSMTPRKAGKALMAALGMRGEELVPKDVNENRVSGKLALTSGENTVEDVQKKSKNIATALGIPKSGVRFTENPDNAAEGDFTFTLRDVLINPTLWPGPSAVGGTPFDTIPMGLYETGNPLLKTLANESGAKNELIQGTTGSGKSSGTRVEMCELMTRREVALIVVDTEKGTQSFGAAAAGLAWLITDAATAKKFLKRLKVAIKQRASYLGARGLDAWVPGCGLTFIVVQIEEAGNLFAEIGDEEAELIAKACRSAGIALKVSLQRPEHGQMSTTLRAQLLSVSCYGMANDDPVCLLPDEVQDAGAEPSRWGDRLPGCCYVAGTGITVGQAATPMRTYKITPEMLKAHADKYGPHMDQIDSLTIRAFGDLWTNRVAPVELVARLNAEALRAAGMPAQIEGEVIKNELDDEEIEAELEGDIEEDEGEIDSLTPEEMGVSTDDDDTDDGTSIDDPIESIGHDMVFGDPTPEVTVAEARAAVAERIAGFEMTGRDTIRVPDFTDLVTAGLRSRAWFRKELMRLVALGRLVDEGDGEFRIVPDVEDDGSDEEDAAA